MNASPSLKSDLTYIAYLTKAVWEGLTTAPKGAPVMAAALWTPTAIGAAIGLLGIGLSRKKRSGYRVAVGGLVGSALGFSAGIGWTSRDFTAAVARSAIQNVNMVRDARWLEKNPIDYA